MHLKYLKVKNFALISEMSLDFSENFSVITGETGAGKSIIVEALGLLLGNRSDTHMIREGAEEAYLEALFSNKKEDFIIKRIIRKDGVNKIFINDELSTLNTLKSLSVKLGEICGQHEPQGLTNPENQLRILDQTLSIDNQLIELNSLFYEFNSLKNELNELNKMEESKDDRLNYLNYKLKEINDVNPSINEEKELTDQIQKVKGMNSLMKLSKKSEFLFFEENSIIEKMEELKRELKDSVKYDNEIQEYLEESSTLLEKLEILARKMLKYGKKLNVDEESITLIHDRLEKLQELKKRYGGSIESIIIKKNSFLEEKNILENITTTKIEKEKRLSKIKEQYLKVSKEIHTLREKSAKVSQDKISKELNFLNMPKAKFVIEVIYDSKIMTAKGSSIVVFKIEPNEGEGLKELAKIASGGELSRVMLAINQILSDKNNKFFVFDEIDAGIGGETGSKIGIKLKNIGAKRQVLCVTHLAQVASYADQHLYISKNTENKRTVSQVQNLKNEDKVKEIARMLGGINSESISLAKTMIKKSLL